MEIYLELNHPIKFYSTEVQSILIAFSDFLLTVPDSAAELPLSIELEEE
jgi:hypothetical protein